MKAAETEGFDYCGSRRCSYLDGDEKSAK